MPELVCGTEDRLAWLAARRQGITATDIVTIMGLVSYDSPWALYHRKQGLLPEVEQSDRMRLGSWLERSIADQWCEGQPYRNEWYRDPWTTGERTGLFRSAVRPWQMATPDRLVPGYGEPPIGVLECKTWSTRDGWGEDQSSTVPASVRAQVLWQMDTLDVGTGYVAVVFLPSGEFRSYTIEHDGHADEGGGFTRHCNVCNDVMLMREKGREFHNRLCDADPPPLDGSQPTLDAVKYLNPNVKRDKTVDVPLDLAQRYMRLCDEVAEMTAAKKQAEAEIRSLMGDAHYAGWDAGILARRDVFKRAESVTRAHEVDRLVRVKPGKDSASADQ